MYDVHTQINQVAKSLHVILHINIMGLFLIYIYFLDLHDKQA